MSREDIIAKRYALGLAEHARNESSLEKTREDLGVLSALFESEDSDDAAFGRFLSSPSVPLAEKLRLAGSVAEKAGLGSAAGKLLEILIRRHRIGLLPRVARLFAEMAGRMAGVLEAEIHTARPLSEDQARRLAEALSGAFGTEVRVRQTVEPALLAGARVSVGGNIIDGAVRGRLERLRRHLVSGGWDRPENSTTAS